MSKESEVVMSGRLELIIGHTFGFLKSVIHVRWSRADVFGEDVGVDEAD